MTTENCKHDWILLTTAAYETLVFLSKTNTPANVRGCKICGFIEESWEGEWSTISAVNPHYDERMELFRLGAKGKSK